MAKKGEMWGKIGSWAFLIGIVVALIVGLYAAYANPTTFFYGSDVGGWIAWLLAVIGAIVGLVSAYGMGTITEKEIPNFLLAGVALIAIGAASNIFVGIKPWIGAIFNGVATSLAIFIAPMMGILAIKAIWDIGKD
ncbi:MAG TPA: hypothetical protein ENI45_02140 [Thermoplasmatales archaeon]|nr:hypothetical protein [Thermoplasmatales archaeon]